MSKKKRQSLIEKGFHVYQGTFRINGESADRQVYKFSPNDPPRQFVLFGDESAFSDLVTFGIISVATGSVRALEKEVVDLLGANNRFHSKIYFNSIARKKSSWKDTPEEQIWELPERILKICAKYQAVFSIGVAHYDTYPNKMKDGFGAEIDIQKAHLYGYACQSALAVLEWMGLLSEKNRAIFIPDLQQSVMKFWGVGRIKIENFFGHRYAKTLKRLDGEKPILNDISAISMDIFG